MKPTHRHPFLVRGVALFTAAAACTSLGVGTATGTPASAGPPPHSASIIESHRGRIISATLLRALTPAQAAAELTAAGYDPTAVRFSVTLYRLVYRTVDEHGRPTTASGLLVLPGTSATRSLNLVSYTHGSQVFRGDAPSVTDDTWNTASPITFASAGFATVAPDYLGLGLGPGQHPWMHVPSEVTASADLLSAARTFLQQSGRRVNPGVRVTGFSQGASAALGLARALQDGQVPGFTLSAVAPISGAYDFRRTEIPALLNGSLDHRWGVVYLAYLYIAWDRLHDLYGSPSEVFRAPYDRTLPNLFDGTHPGQEVLPGLPDSVDRLLTDRGRDLLRHPKGRLAAALRVADATCSDWTPRAPIRLYATRTDEQAAFGNALACRTAFGRRGVDVPIVEVGDTDHGDSNVRATADLVRWFSSH
jgi:hypothetical protein